MPRDPRHDILFEEVKIGPKTMRNRFYQSPHCTSLGTEFPLAHAHLRAMKAEGGWAVVNTEYCSVHPSSDSTPLLGSRLWDEEDVRKLEVMVDMAHEQDSLAGVELWAGGFVAGNLESRMPARGAAQATETGTYAGGCYALDKAGIREVQQQYVDASKRAAQAGFDIINVQGSENGAIVTHFLMSRHNQRTDEYGGSFENRARFWLETLEQIREAVGDQCAITTRLCADALNDSPLGIRAEVEALRLHRPRRSPGRLLGPTDRRLGRRGLGRRGRRPLALQARVASARPHRGGPQGDEEARRRGRALHQPRHDGRGGPVGGHRDHRGGAPVDRRPVPAEEDRGGPLRRDPRVHRLQHLRLALPPKRSDHLHAERDLGRGVPARLASGEVHEGRQQRSHRSGRRRRPGRDGVRAGPGRARDGPRPPRRRARRARRCAANDRGLSPPRRVGPRHQLPPDRARSPAQRRRDPGQVALSRRDARVRRRDRDHRDRLLLARRRGKPRTA